MLFFLAEALWTLITLAGFFDQLAAAIKLVFFAVNDSVLLVFWLFQKLLIIKKFRGMTLSVHLVIIKAIFDLITSYFVWSHFQKF